MTVRDDTTGYAILGEWYLSRLSRLAAGSGGFASSRETEDALLHLLVDPVVLSRAREEERARDRLSTGDRGSEALRVLIIGGAGASGQETEERLRGEGCDVFRAATVEEASSMFAESWDVVLADGSLDFARLQEAAGDRRVALLVDGEGGEQVPRTVGEEIEDWLIAPVSPNDAACFVHRARDRKRREFELRAAKEEAETARREQRLTREIARGAGSAVDMRDLANVLAGSVARSLSPDLIRCWAWGPDGAVSWESGKRAGSLHDAARHLQDQLLALLVGAEATSERTSPKEPADPGLPASWIAVPILAGAELGALVVVAARDTERFTPATARLLYRVGEEVSLGVMRGRDLVAEERRRLELVVNRSNEGVIVTDGRGTPLLLNGPARLMLNLPLEGEPAEVIDASEGGKTLFYYLSSMMGRAEESSTREFLVEGEPPRRLTVRAVVLRNEAGECRGALALLDDVTSRREVDLMQSEFVTAISHELRTPLSCVKNYVDMVLDRRAGEVNDTQERFLATARRNVDRLTDLIDNLLRLSRSSSGAADASLDVVDLGALTANIIEELRAEAEERTIELVTAVPPGELEVRGEGDRLGEAWKLVLRESIKLGARGACLLVTGVRVDREVIEPPSDGSPLPPHQRWVRLGVRISPTALEPGASQGLFHRFRVNREDEGRQVIPSGLSLAIARNLIEAHEGLIWSEPRGDNDLVLQLILPINGPSMRRGAVTERVTQLIQHCRQTGVPMSLVVMRLESPEAAGGRGKGGGRRAPAPESVLHAVTAVARHCLRGEDRFFPDPSEGEIVLLLERSDKRGSAVVGRRLIEGLRAMASETPDPLQGCLLEIGWASFPQEGITAQEIITLARHRCTALTAPGETES